MRVVKFFVAFGHRYRIVRTTKSKKEAQAAMSEYKGSWKDIYSISAVLHQLANGRWAIGVRKLNIKGR